MVHISIFKDDLSSMGLLEWAEAEPNNLTPQAIEVVTARGAYLEPEVL
jgi:hypothetical protein